MANKKMKTIDEISEELKEEIQEKGYETKSGRICFSKKLRDKFRRALEDHVSDKILLVSKMINIYNGDLYK